MLGAGDLLIESGGEEGQQRFTDIRNPDRVQQLIHAQMKVATRTACSSAPATGAPSTSPTQLEKLEGIRDRGSLTPEEFEAQKRKLLG